MRPAWLIGSVLAVLAVLALSMARDSLLNIPGFADIDDLPGGGQHRAAENHVDARPGQQLLCIAERPFRVVVSNLNGHYSAHEFVRSDLPEGASRRRATDRPAPLPWSWVFRTCRSRANSVSSSFFSAS
jgi:hypothetical protein